MNETMLAVVKPAAAPGARLEHVHLPSYGPRDAAKYFKKLECFCFAKQTLQPGEVRQMPVVFVVDPKAPADLHTITLSYTFFEVEGAGKLLVETSGAAGRL